MVDAIHQYGQISLGSRGGVSQGQLKITGNGLVWRGLGHGMGKIVEIKSNDITGLLWTKVPRGCQLGVRRKQGATVNFLGFREKDYEQLNAFCSGAFGYELKEQLMSLSGRNWGSVAINGSSLMFLVDGKVAFEVPLPDVSGAQQTKDEVMMEFHVDDTSGGDREDALVEMAFHVPPTNEDFPPQAVEDNAAKMLLGSVLAHADVDAASSGDAVCIFEEVGVLVPRGRYDIEMHLGFLKLTGQSQDFKIRYQSIQRIFVLPKTSTPHTLVVISLDPPIRKGQTLYSHILCQMASDEEVTMTLDISPEALAAKNEKCGGKLHETHSGPAYEVLAKVLRGLSGVKITKPGSFRNAAGDGYCVRCSLKSDDGYLYPLERAFFYVHKPPLLIPHEEIDNVEFQRQGGGVLSSSVRTFDLVVRTLLGPEHQFRNIARSEWQNLFDFLHAKRIRIENLAAAQHGPGGPGTAYDVGDEMDPGMRAAVAEGEESDEEEEEDEDFEASDDEEGGSGGGDDDDEGSDTDASEGSSGDAEMVAEEGIGVADITGKKRKGGAKEGGGSAKRGKSEGKGPAKRGRKKKDPNAPKKALTPFMFFANHIRDSVKADNPGIAFGDVGKVIGERWKELAADDKRPFEEQAAADKERYATQMRQYQASQNDADQAESEENVSEDDE